MHLWIHKEFRKRVRFFDFTFDHDWKNCVMIINQIK